MGGGIGGEAVLGGAVLGGAVLGGGDDCTYNVCIQYLSTNTGNYTAMKLGSWD